MRDEKQMSPLERTLMETDRFNEFLLRLVEVTHDLTGDYDRDNYVVLIRDICEYYHLAKGVSEFYRSPSMEKRGQGEVFCDFDDGHGDVLSVYLRISTDSGAVVVGKLYVSQDTTPKDEEEKARLSILLRIILGFIARRRLQRTLEQFGFHDEQGFPNFRAFVRFLDRLNSAGTVNQYCTVHYDLHNFSLVNQEVGRARGDIVLHNHIAMLMDIVGDRGLFCRLGGDKFVGIFHSDLQEQVLNHLTGVPVVYDEEGDKRIYVSAAAGVYKIPSDYKDIFQGEIMDKVMIASSIAKRQEDGALVFFDEKMLGMRDQMRWVQARFRPALEKEEFKVYYQPKVDIQTREIVGAEALCRWFHDGRLIPPMEFIPILEQNTDICYLDFYMLDHVCKDIRRWLDEGRKVVRVSVNLSRKHMVDVDLLEHIMTVIDRNHVPHEYIEVELTETTTDVKFRDLKRVVGGLREAGVCTAVDDFGMGYSSLNLIREIPWDVLKVDRCFLPMDEEQENSITRVMFKHVVSMAQDLGMKCVVEGVETVKQLDVLRENNCFIAQGFYFDRPLPVDEFEARMAGGPYGPKQEEE